MNNSRHAPHELEGFEYWSENSIDRKFLDTVARKYVLTFRCSNAYVERTTKIVKEEEKKTRKFYI